MFIYYVYAYLRANGTPYYVGKGKDKRAFGKNHRIPVPKDPQRILFIATDLNEYDAFALEMFFISWYGRKDNGTGILRNLTDGGEGASGAIRNDATRQKISTTLTGRKLSFEERARKTQLRRRHTHLHGAPKAAIEATRKKCTDSVAVYDSLKEMSLAIGLSHTACYRRLKSPNFPEFQYL